jgi:hypothetical protein
MVLVSSVSRLSAPLRRRLIPASIFHLPPNRVIPRFSTTTHHAMGSAQPPDLPYWQVNVPPSERTAECPDFLRDLSPKDIGIISTPDADYHVDTWPEVVQRVAANRLDLFQRVPSDLRRYLAYNWQTRREYGSVMKFMLSERLGWSEPVVPEGREPFSCERDVKVLWNDWPYGIDERIVHLVVWTKFGLEEDPKTGDLTEKARGQIEDYVRRTFRDTMPDGHVRALGAQSHLLCSPSFTRANEICRLCGSRTGPRSSPSRLLSISTSCCSIRTRHLWQRSRAAMSPCLENYATNSVVKHIAFPRSCAASSGSPVCSVFLLQPAFLLRAIRASNIDIRHQSLYYKYS